MNGKGEREPKQMCVGKCRSKWRREREAGETIKGKAGREAIVSNSVESLKRDACTWTWVHMRNRNTHVHMLEQIDPRATETASTPAETRTHMHAHAQTSMNGDRCSK